MKDHIIVCIFAHKNSISIGLCNFVMPLRSSSMKRDELKSIVFVGDEDYLRKEWQTLKNFPNVYVKLVLILANKQTLFTQVFLFVFFSFIFKFLNQENRNIYLYLINLIKKQTFFYFFLLGFTIK